MAETFPPSAGQAVPVPLPRDTPPPPGYVDPLEGSEVLDELVAAETEPDAEPGAGTGDDRTAEQGTDEHRTDEQRRTATE
jgi:hypothetical protein